MSTVYQTLGKGVIHAMIPASHSKNRVDWHPTEMKGFRRRPYRTPHDAMSGTMTSCTLDLLWSFNKECP